MTITTLPCNNCLCSTCHDNACRILACENCQLEPVRECDGYIGEVKVG